jgi:pyruvate,water dikinase
MGAAAPADRLASSPGVAPVVWFDELEGDVRAVAGGKSASLVEMRRAGFPVPPGFAITVAAFESFGAQTGVTAQVERIVARTDPDSTESLQAASKQIEALAAQVRLPAGLLSLIESAYQRMARETGEEDPAVAVRSSAVGEDSAEASFAGQQETYLWVRGLAEVELAVRRCWASYFSPQALSYRARLSGGHGLGTVGMSVCVQQMVDASVAGVMFTRSPTTNDRSIIAIEAGFGLGVAVVAGEITPDQVWVNKVTRAIVKRQPGYKQVRYVPNRDTGGTTCVDVPEDEATRLCLDDDIAMQLADYGVRLERHYGAAQDVEWALTRGADDIQTIVLLQSRPITTGRTNEPIVTPLPSQTDYVVQQLLATSQKKIEL